MNGGTSAAASAIPGGGTPSLLSYSRLHRYATCPLSYKLHYIDGIESEASEPLAFGRAIHAVLERLYAEVVLGEEPVPLLVARAYDLFEHEFFAARLSGRELFGEGLDLLRDYCTNAGVVDPATVLAIEKPFELTLGEHKLVGIIDRIDQVDRETVEVVDYKTNRNLYAREEVDGSLQLALYELAARRLYPWAKRVRLSYVMLRFGALKQWVDRDENDCEVTERYVPGLARKISDSSEFPARIGPNCAHCDFRRQCPAYAEALSGARREEVTAEPTDLAALSRERQHVVTLSRLLAGRQREIDAIFKARLKERAEPLTLEGVRYSFLKTSSVRYPLEPSIEVLARATGRSASDLANRLATLDKDRLTRFLEKECAGLESSRARLLRAELAASAETTVSTRLWAKELGVKTSTPASAESGAAAVTPVAETS
ncbi:MAG: PD-(D/E)XK nuclease family protein [Kofleriaceae bacterium]|nr:PD-(D/E)XK nuclease family protein [Kofleriaceae bacterium]